MQVAVLRYHARDSCVCCVCVSVIADTDTGCVLVTVDDLGVVSWWMFEAVYGDVLDISNIRVWR